MVAFCFSLVLWELSLLCSLQPLSLLASFSILFILCPPTHHLTSFWQAVHFFVPNFKSPIFWAYQKKSLVLAIIANSFQLYTNMASSQLSFIHTRNTCIVQSIFYPVILRSFDTQLYPTISDDTVFSVFCNTVPFFTHPFLSFCIILYFISSCPTVLYHFVTVMYHIVLNYTLPYCFLL